MDGPKGNHARGNKPGRKREMLSDLICMWDRGKANKRTKKKVKPTKLKHKSREEEVGDRWLWEIGMAVHLDRVVGQ